jgi:cyanophycinase
LKDEDLAICGAKLHILPHGYRFDLASRQPIFEGASATTGQRESEGDRTPLVEA